MRVNLIFPRLTDTTGQLYAPSLVSRILRPLLGLGEMGFTPPLSLLMLAAVTPPDAEVHLVDQRLEEVDYDAKVDLVGISVVTRSAPGAYRIADEYRKRGVKVVLGGVHPSALPQEASLHADAVVVGEGEAMWPRIIADHKNGRLQPLYYGGHDADLGGLPLARRDVIPHPEKYGVVKVVTASRGCPNGCAFCACGIAVGRRYRTRPVEDVVNELRSIPGKVAFFADDNLGWNVAYTKSLLRAMAPLRIRWAGELSLHALEDEELVDLLAESGCVVLGMGFESLSPTVIAAIRKNRTNDPARYPELIRRVHRRRIPILGHFMVGFDEDDAGVFGRIADFVDETRLEMPSIATLIPYPGTSVYRQMEREHRLLHKDWNRYDTLAGQVVFRLGHLSPQELLDGYQMLTKRLHTAGGAVRRLAGAGTLFTVGALPAIHYNIQSARSIADDIQRMNPAPASLAKALSST